MHCQYFYCLNSIKLLKSFVLKMFAFIFQSIRKLQIKQHGLKKSCHMLVANSLAHWVFWYGAFWANETTFRRHRSNNDRSVPFSFLWKRGVCHGLSIDICIKVFYQQDKFIMNTVWYTVMMWIRSSNCFSLGILRPFH